MHQLETLGQIELSHCNYFQERRKRDHMSHDWNIHHSPSFVVLGREIEDFTCRMGNARWVFLRNRFGQCGVVVVILRVDIYSPKHLVVSC